MARPWDDCRFFVLNQCRNALCKFRHSPEARNAPVCLQWEKGLCQNILCPKKHVVVKEKSAIPCHFERLPQGCTNSECAFMHLKPRDLEDLDLQKKLAKFLAEHEMMKEEKSKENVQKCEEIKRVKEVEPTVIRPSEDSSSEDDLIAMRARILQQQVKSNGITKKVKNDEHKKTTRMKTTTKPTPEPTVEPVKRRIVSKSRYSEDEASDISLDELTDEEPEDLRATLNKSKQNKRTDGAEFTRKISNDVDFCNETKRKKQEKPPTTLNRGGRIISIRKNAKTRLGEVSGGDSSRPSSSEWIERKITVKKSEKSQLTKREVNKRDLTNRNIANRLIKGVQISEATSESDYSDTQSHEDSPRAKRKPNMSWVNVDDLSVKQRLGAPVKSEDTNKSVLSSRLNRFATSGLTRSVDSSVNRGVKSRLGNVSDDTGKAGIKSRLGVNVNPRQTSQTKKTPAPDKREKSDEEIPPKRKKLLLVKKKRIPDEKKENQSSNPKEPASQVTNPPSPPKSTVQEVAIETPPTPIERRNSKRRNSKSSANSPRIRNHSQPGSKSQKQRADSTMDDLESELLGLDDPDNLIIDGDIEDDDLFDDL
jgi:hypothetical protein